MEPWKNFSQSARKFLALSEPLRHKYAAIGCRAAYLDPTHFDDYQRLETLLSLPQIPYTKEALSDRYHYHLRAAYIAPKEDQFLPLVSHLDALTGSPFLPIDIYLDNLRSAHNIGSIIRTTEAFRLGQIHSKGPLPNPAKLEKTAMGTLPLVTCYENSPLSALRRPLIAIETHKDALSLYNFIFPPTFSLLLGNEEYGLSEESITSANVILKVPLHGAKNSLNVASCFALISNEIRRQLYKS